MSDVLKEFERLSDRIDSDDADEIIRTAIQALMHHQVVYDDTHGLPKIVFATLVENLEIFQRYFSTSGFDLVYDSQAQMVALKMQETEKTHYAWRQLKLKKDETLIRLVLRYMFEKAMTDGSMEATGRVKTDTARIIDTFERMTDAPPPSERYLMENILRDLTRCGAVRVGDRIKEERLTEVTILPGIRIHVSDSQISALDQEIDDLKQEQNTQ